MCLKKARDDPSADRLLRIELRDTAAVYGRAAVSNLVVVPIDLLIEVLGVKRVGGAGDTGDDRKRNQGGQDGLHGISPLISVPAAVRV